VRAVLAHDLDLERAAGHRVPALDLRQILGEHAPGFRRRGGRQHLLEAQLAGLVGRVAGDPLDGWTDVGDVEIEIGRPDDVHDVVRHEPVAGLALLERGLRAAPLRHVAEAPHPAGHLPALALRLRVPLEDAPVLELQHVEALGLGRVVELVDLVEEPLRIGELVEHGGDGRLVVTLRHHRVGDPPQVHELAVVADDAPVAVHHQDAVRRRVEDRAIRLDRRGAPGPGSGSAACWLAGHGRQVDAFPAAPLAFSPPRPGGEIGRHAILRGWWRNPCRFESGPGH